MQYFKLAQDGSNDKQDYSIEQLRSDNNMTSFPDILSETLLADWNVFPYTIDRMPENDGLVNACSLGNFIKKEDGTWTREWVVTPLAPMIAEYNIRTQRDRLLFESDWVATKSLETNKPVPQNYAVYRQALRDITLQTGFPYNVTWPVITE